MPIGTYQRYDVEHGDSSPFPVSWWQAEDLDYLVNDLDGSSANWSEMGAWKTTTALRLVARKLRNAVNPNVLVIATKSAKGTWFRHVPALLPDWQLFNVTTKGINLVVGDHEIKIPDMPFVPVKIQAPSIVVAHYDIFARFNAGQFELDTQDNPVLAEDGTLVMKPLLQGDHLVMRNWDFIVLDEAHRIKTRGNKSTVNIKKLKAPYRHIMTGTGFINRPDEIWSLLNFLDKKQFSSYWAFRDEYCYVSQVYAYGKPAGYTIVEGIKPEKVEDFRKLVRRVGVRRTLDEVMPHIRKSIFTRIDVELSKVQRRMYDQIKAELYTLDQKGVPLESPNVLTLLSRLRQICVATPEVTADFYDAKQDRRVIHVTLREPSSKLDALMETIEGLQWDNEIKQPLVVFSNFKDPLELLKARLDKAKIPYIHMAQQDSDQVRYQKWAVEFPKLEHRVFMSTLQLGSESISLTPARHVCFLDRSWSPLHNSQGIGRIRRPGQAGEPVVINIEAKNSTDQYVEENNLRKEGWFKQIFGDESG